MEANVANAEGNCCEFCRFAAEKSRVLFAEDMVQFAMCINGFNVVFTSNERYRNVMYPAFTESVALSVSYLNLVLFGEVSNDVAIQRLRGMVTSEGFEWYSRSLVANFVSQVENMESILKTCVRIALATVFYYREGVTTTLQTAVTVIASAVNYDLSRGGWKMLQDAAENFDKMYYAIENMPTPSTDSDQSPVGEQLLDDRSSSTDDSI